MDPILIAAAAVASVFVLLVYLIIRVAKRHRDYRKPTAKTDNIESRPAQHFPEIADARRRRRVVLGTPAKQPDALGDRGAARWKRMTKPQVRSLALITACGCAAFMCAGIIDLIGWSAPPFPSTSPASAPTLEPEPPRRKILSERSPEANLLKWKEHQEQTQSLRETLYEGFTGRSHKDRHKLGMQDVKHLRLFLARMNASDIDAKHVSMVNVRGDWAIIRITDAWNAMSYERRLDAARKILAMWADILSPQAPDRARIRFYSVSGWGMDNGDAQGSCPDNPTELCLTP